MYTIVLALHLFVCLLLILAVLVQSGKGSSLGSAFGGGQGDVFGPGAPVNIMNRVTTVVAILFMVTSLTLAIISTEKTTGSVINSAPAQSQQAPAAPSAPASPVVPSESK
jgi:preprotein translocase subunit SecG